MKWFAWVGLALLLVLGACVADGDDDDSTPADEDANDDDTTDDDTVDDDVHDDDVDDDSADDDTVVDDDTASNRGSLIPGPGEPRYNADLEMKAFRYAQQIQGMSAWPFGVALDTFLLNEDARNQVKDWLTNSTLDENFEEYTGTPVYDVVDHFLEFEDLGMFGGVAAVGDILRYALARDEGTDVGGETLDELRENVVDLLEALHICVAITGVRGVIARGISPRGLPGGDPETTPLFDEFGNPLPVNKGNTWREDNSGGLYPDWLWFDNVSKDQMLGYMFEIAVLWETIVDDPTIDASLKTRLQDDVAGIGDALMEVAPEDGLDLSIRDADGRLTSSHDLNPRELEGTILPTFIGNGFNAVAALGIFKTIALVTGEERFRDFFVDMMGSRHFPRFVDQTFKYSNTGPIASNWSNVNMAFVAIFPLLRYEADPEQQSYWRTVVLRDLWQGWLPGWSVARTNLGFFGVIYSAFAPGATDNQAADAAAHDLHHFGTPPVYEVPIENCDEAEIKVGRCVAIDGETVIHLTGVHIAGFYIPFYGHNGLIEADTPLPRELRPASNYDWRSSPYRVNGGGTMRLEPGGDFHAAYWLGRYLRRGEDSAINISEYAW